MEALRRAWVQQFRRHGEPVRWRASGDLLPSSLFISSPHDSDAHYAKERTTRWVGSYTDSVPGWR